MSGEAYVGGAWRDLTSAKVCIDGINWKTITRGLACVDGTNWVPIANFVPPLSVSISPDAQGLASSNKPTRVVTNAVTATPTGGKAPFSYVWSLLSGSPTITSPTNASTTFSQVVAPGGSASATARVTVTDALGSTATADVSISFENGGV